MERNFRCVLKGRPGADNEPSLENFTYEECDIPQPPAEGEVTIQTMFLSVDPALRCRMNEDTGVDYINPWQLSEAVLGLGGVGMVITSNILHYSPGDIVQSVMNWPWVKYFNTRVDDPLFPLSKVDPDVKDKPQCVLSVLGVTGLTSYLGVVEHGHVTKGANQTFVVSGAAGACGNLAGQIARLKGASNIVGICGSDSKCEYLTSQLGFTAAINYKTESVNERLRETCPDGIHTYFDNVGGDISETVIDQMVPGGHVILCGQIAVYNKDVPYPPPISEHLQNIITEKNIDRKRFLVLNYQDKYPAAMKQLTEWYQSGDLKVPEFIHEGLEKAGEAFVNMLISQKQDKVGKQLIKVV